MDLERMRRFLTRLLLLSSFYEVRLFFKSHSLILVFCMSAVELYIFLNIFRLIRLRRELLRFISSITVPQILIYVIVEIFPKLIILVLRFSQLVVVVPLFDLQVVPLAGSDIFCSSLILLFTGYYSGLTTWHEARERRIE